MSTGVSALLELRDSRVQLLGQYLEAHDFPALNIPEPMASEIQNASPQDE